MLHIYLAAAAEGTVAAAAKGTVVAAVGGTAAVAVVAVVVDRHLRKIKMHLFFFLFFLQVLVAL